MVNCTQCLRGTVDQSTYQAGSALAECGVISGQDMTIEAALAKLIYLFSLNLSLQEIQKAIVTNLRGELTPADEESTLVYV